MDMDSTNRIINALESISLSLKVLAGQKLDDAHEAEARAEYDSSDEWNYYDGIEDLPYLSQEERRELKERFGNNNG